MTEESNHSFKPRYLQIQEDLLREYQKDPTARIASERELCRQYGVCRPTIQQALRYLVENGMVVRSKGNGSFFRPVPSVPEVQIGVKLVLRKDWCGWIGDSFFGQTVQGIYVALRGTGHNLSIEQYSDKLRLELLDSPDLPSIWLSPETTEMAALKELADSGRPVTVLNRRPMHPGIHFASVDHHRDGEMAAEFILSHSNRRVLFLFSEREKLLAREREIGLLEALKNSGRAIDYHRISIPFARIDQALHEVHARWEHEPDLPLLIINSASLFEDVRNFFTQFAGRTLLYVDNGEPIAPGLVRICQPIAEIGRVGGLIAGCNRLDLSGTLEPGTLLD